RLEPVVAQLRDLLQLLVGDGDPVDGEGEPPPLRYSGADLALAQDLVARVGKGALDLRRSGWAGLSPGDATASRSRGGPRHYHDHREGAARVHRPMMACR